MHGRGPRSHACGHWPVALARMYSLHSTTDLILQSGRLRVHDPTTMVLKTLRIQPSTKPTKHPTHTFPDPGPVLWTERHPFFGHPTKSPSDPQAPRHHSFQPKIFSNHPARIHSKCTTKNTSRSPSQGPSETSDQNSFQITQPRSIQKFLGKLHLMPQVHTHSPAP